MGQEAFEAAEEKRRRAAEYFGPAVVDDEAAEADHAAKEIAAAIGYDYEHGSVANKFWVWDQNTKNMLAIVKRLRDHALLKAIHEVEKQNPKYPGGRTMVLNAIEDRVGEIHIGVKVEDEVGDDGDVQGAG